QGHQYRSPACAVRQYPGNGRPDPVRDRVQHHDHASGAGGDLSPVGDRKRRSGVPAHREPGRRAGASGVSRARRGQSGQRLSRARHLARGRLDDPACGHRAILVARHYRHDLHCGGERGRLGLCRTGPVVPDPGAFRAGDHPGGRGAVHRIRAVRQRQRHRAAVVSRPPPRSVTGQPMPRLPVWLICSLLTASALPAQAQGRLNVVASFSILADFAQNVGGERASVATLVGPDSDVHVYTPAPADARKVADARLLIVNGLGLEGWLPRLVQSSGGKAAIVTATRGIVPLEIGGAADPHAWQSVVDAKIYVANIRDAFVAADPPDAGVFRSNADGYLAKLDALDREVRIAVEQIPAARRKVISTHRAFGYFAAAYGIQFIAPFGVSTDSEPSA